jgi:hypothetical protein
LTCDRQFYAKVLDLLKSIKKTKEWREYRKEGASSFTLDFVEKLMNASVNGPNGKPDMLAVRNKAVGVAMILFGAHPLDMHRMHEDNVRNEPEHIDREGYRRPKFVVGGHDQLDSDHRYECKSSKLTEYHIHPTADCKFKCYKSSNVIGCGCPYHHSHSNPRCAYNVIRQYKPNTRGLHMVVKAASDHSFRLHGMAKWSRKQRRKHIGVRMYYFVYTPMETEGGPLRSTWFWRSWSKKERRFNHGRMSDKDIRAVYKYWNLKLGLGMQVATGSMARKTFCTKSCRVCHELSGTALIGDRYAGNVSRTSNFRDLK